MRLVILIATVACAASVASGVQAREDRYGPGLDRRTASAEGYAGPVLSWASKRDAPPPAPQPLNRPWPRSAQGSQPVAQPALERPSTPLVTAPPTTQVATAPAMGPNMARTYSVGRLYGQQPDPLAPLQPNGMVFIAPSEERAPAKTEPPRHGSAEWLAQAPLDTDEPARGADAKDNTL